MIRFVFALFLICMFPVSANAQERLDYSYFSEIPVQHEGRVKPFDTFARAALKSFSGGESVEGRNAQEWLAQTLFDPASALNQPLFRIFKPDILELPARKSRLYSYVELSGALRDKAALIEKLLQTEPKSWSEDQKELARLQEQSLLYGQMLRSFSLLLPLNLDVPEALAAKWGIDGSQPVTLREIQGHEQELAQAVQEIVRRKGDDPANYPGEEKAIAAFAFNVDILKQGGQFNALLRVIPQADGEWLSPWQTTDSENLQTWQEAAKAYLAQDAGAFTEATKELSAQADGFKTALELSYNAYHPLGLATGLYLLAFLLFAASRVWQKPAFHTASFVALSAACAVHVFAVVARVVILERPPVGTLYESILFVAIICALISLILETRRKDGNGLLAGSLSGMLLLFTAQGFAADDTMQMLVAVLNTNFWLATHVLCITTGYAICLLASFFAHLHLFKAGRGEDLSGIRSSTRTLGLVALLFTCIGTILGGIWADQSWGRFWGWDPKENGALLIVLWIVWLYHGQLSGHIRQLAFMAGLAALSIVVALAWFGVNLLNVGLHSYGFITGVAAGLGAFCLIEASLIGFLWFKAAQRGRQAS